jgi:class 3 adenylate cyclase
VRLGISRHVQPEYWSILVIDMTGSGRWNDLTQLRTRAALDRLVHAAFRSAGIARHRLVMEDRGDGMIVLVPPTVSKVDLFCPVLARLCDLLRKHNNATEPRIRLRVALHAGEVLRGPCGWVGTDLNTACRMVNGAPLYRELLRNPRSDLVLIVSDTVHQAVVRHGHRGIDPAEYTPVHVQVKELDTRAWIERPHQTNAKWSRLGRSG